MDAETILKRLDTIQEIRTLPGVYLRVSQLLDEPTASAKRLSQIIEQDAALVLKLLRLVNSAFYGLPNRVSSIPEAIVRLGFNTVRNALLSISVFKTFSRSPTNSPIDTGDLWRHSLAVAVTNRFLSKRTRREDPESCFVSGLLHDIGKVVLLQYFREEFARVMQTLQTDGQGFLKAEKRCLPLQHPAIGSHLARKWRLPQALVETIRLHHGVLSPQSSDLLCLTMAADVIVNHYLPQHCQPASDVTQLEGCPAWLQEYLASSASWFPELNQEIENACAFFMDQPAAPGASSSSCS